MSNILSSHCCLKKDKSIHLLHNKTLRRHLKTKKLFSLVLHRISRISLFKTKNQVPWCCLLAQQVKKRKRCWKVMCGITDTFFFLLRKLISRVGILKKKKSFLLLFIYLLLFSSSSKVKRANKNLQPSNDRYLYNNKLNSLKKKGNLSDDGQMCSNKKDDRVIINKKGQKKRELAESISVFFLFSWNNLLLDKEERFFILCLFFFFLLMFHPADVCA